MANNELYHYGVIGMKWGVRRAQKRGTDYTYTSLGTKHYKRKAEQASKNGDVVKQKKYEQYHKKSVELDRKMQTNALANSTGKVVAKTLLNGPFGGGTYEAVKVTSGNAKYTSRIIANATAAMTGPFGEIPARMLYVREQAR